MGLRAPSILPSLTWLTQVEQVFFYGSIWAVVQKLLWEV